MSEYVTIPLIGFFEYGDVVAIDDLGYGVVADMHTGLGKKVVGIYIDGPMTDVQSVEDARRRLGHVSTDPVLGMVATGGVIPYEGVTPGKHHWACDTGVTTTLPPKGHRVCIGIGLPADHLLLQIFYVGRAA